MTARVYHITFYLQPSLLSISPISGLMKRLLALGESLALHFKNT